MKASKPASVLLALLALGAPLASSFVSSDARASVSIAVLYDALLKDASTVAIITPIEARSVWEGGRIYTYTRVHVDTAVAGDLGTGGEAWVRTLGGVVNHIGQSVDGEPVFTVGRPSLLFLRPGPPGALEVSARAQGQFPVTLDDQKVTRVMRSSGIGVLFPPKAVGPRASEAAPPATPGGLAPKTETVTPAPANPAVGPLASEMIHGKRVEEAVREIASAWKRVHGG